MPHLAHSFQQFHTEPKVHRVPLKGRTSSAYVLKLQFKDKMVYKIHDKKCLYVEFGHLQSLRNTQRHTLIIHTCIDTKMAIET